MDTITPDAPVESVPDVSDESSLSDHEAQFNGNTPRPDEPIDAPPDVAEETDGRDEKGRFRHRASSQRAGADDVPTINALTKELRAAEEELYKSKPDAANETPRIRSLKRQIAAVRAELGTGTPEPVKTVESRPEPARQSEPVTATRTKPIEDEIGTKYQTYADFTEDLADWKWEQREAAKVAKEQESRQADEYYSIINGYQARLRSFAERTPDFVAVTEELSRRVLPPALLQAVTRDDKAAEYVYHLAQHPELTDELYLQTHGKAPDADLVATVQRRLNAALQRSQAATTGSAAVARPAYIPPRPPNPVRTGPIRTGEDLPGDESSLADHEKAYTKPRR